MTEEQDGQWGQKGEKTFHIVYVWLMIQNYRSKGFIPWQKKGTGRDSPTTIVAYLAVKRMVLRSPLGSTTESQC